MESEEKAFRKYDDGDHYYYKHKEKDYKYNKKKDFLGDLFDFD